MLNTVHLLGFGRYGRAYRIANLCRGRYAPFAEVDKAERGEPLAQRPKFRKTIWCLFRNGGDRATVSSYRVPAISAMR